MDSNLTEIVNLTYGQMNMTMNGTLNGTPLDLTVNGSFTSPPIPYLDYIFQIEIAELVLLVVITILLFLILIKRQRVML